jgi:hypothetical protein
LPMTPTQKATSLLLAWISYVSRLTILLFYFYFLLLLLFWTFQVVLNYPFQKRPTVY